MSCERLLDPGVGKLGEEWEEQSEKTSRTLARRENLRVGVQSKSNKACEDKAQDKQKTEKTTHQNRPQI